MDQLKAAGKNYDFYSIIRCAESEGLEIDCLPLSLKILLENLLRSGAPGEDIRALASWTPANRPEHSVSFHPARVLMQDFTGVPAVADLAAMRDAAPDPRQINPQIPVDLVIDHSVMVDHYGTPEAFKRNVDLEFERNQERYRFLKWGQDAFENVRIVPPETGIIHQINLEYLARVVWTRDENGRSLAYPDTLVGTDSHTTMVNGMGVLGWGVGGIEAEAAMLGQPVTMLIPDVTGFRLEGRLPDHCTATDLVLTVVSMLRAKGVVGQFVEFFGPGLDSLSLADRATISNMAPEYGATCGLFPIDRELIDFLRLTGRGAEQAELTEAYAKAQGMWRSDDVQAAYSRTIVLDMGHVVPCVAGPRRPQDLVPLSGLAGNFRKSLNDVYTVKNPETEILCDDFKMTHGHVVIASITSCTNTSNPAVLAAAGLLARNARRRGLNTQPWVKTSFAPGSRVVTAYLEQAGLTEDLDALGFHLVGYGCATCIGNSGPLPQNVSDAISEGQLVTANVLSGNRNFEGRVSPVSKASYLASPPLVVAYALAGSVLKDFERDPLGIDSDGNQVFLKDIWPSPEDIRKVLSITPQLFHDVYSGVFEGPAEWQKLDVPSGDRYDWQAASTYIRRPPFFENQSAPERIQGARCLAVLGDSVTTDHISPAGSIPPDSPAGQYLKSKGTDPEDFNSYGSRRGNHEVMMRGTFANIRIKNAMVPGVEGGFTAGPDGDTVSIYDAAMSWKDKQVPLIVLAGKEYGTGSSRDWAAKGPMLLGVRVVVAESFERIHRSNLVGMGILPLEFADGASAQNHGLTGFEEFTVSRLNAPRQRLELEVSTNGTARKIPVICRIDTPEEMDYWRSGGILNLVLKNLQNGN